MCIGQMLVGLMSSAKGLSPNLCHQMSVGQIPISQMSPNVFCQVSWPNVSRSIVCQPNVSLPNQLFFDPKSLNQNRATDLQFFFFEIVSASLCAPDYGAWGLYHKTFTAIKSVCSGPGPSSYSF
jgi:hypothetical protein